MGEYAHNFNMLTPTGKFHAPAPALMGTCTKQQVLGYVCMHVKVFACLKNLCLRHALLAAAGAAAAVASNFLKSMIYGQDPKQPQSKLQMGNRQVKHN